MKIIFALIFSLFVTPVFAQAGHLQPWQIWGNPSASASLPTQGSVSAYLDGAISCSAQGSILYRGASVWACLAPGTAGKPLLSSGAAANPSYGTLGLGGGGTGQTTAVAARQASGLNVYGDQGTGYGNTAQVLANTDRFAYTNAAFTASRTWTLPAANVTGAPYTVKIADLQGTVTGSNTLVISRAGSDTINGVTTVTISVAFNGYECTSDGVSKWSCLALGSSSTGVTGVTCGTGLSGGTITTTGTCAVNLPKATNSLTGDVALSNPTVYFDGPSMAQGTTGIWFASGTVTVFDSVNASFTCKLWDGTTVVASAAINTNSTFLNALSLSGYFVSPAANIRISCKNAGDVTGSMLFNASGNSMDSTISGIRIN